MENSETEIKELERKIAEVKKRFPYHSVQPYLIQELEDLEEQLEKLTSAKKPGQCDEPYCSFAFHQGRELFFT